MAFLLDVSFIILRKSSQILSTQEPVKYIAHTQSQDSSTFKTNPLFPAMLEPHLSSSIPNDSVVSSPPSSPKAHGNAFALASRQD